MDTIAPQDDRLALLETLKPQSVPLRIDEGGGVRIGRTRVPLDLLVSAFQDGTSPEQVVEDYDTLQREDVYAVFAYYLHHREVVDKYPECARKKTEAIRREGEAAFPTKDLRERWLARRARMRPTA